MLQALPLYKLYPTAPFKSFLKAVYDMHAIGESMMKSRFKQLQKLAQEGEVLDEERISLVEHLLIEEKLTKEQALSQACDLLSAGVDTSSDTIYEKRESELVKRSLPLECKCFKTSIWDETLYKAWSQIVHLLIPNVNTLEMHLDSFAGILDADEVLLFERATFLVIAHSVKRQHSDIHRFEKISNIVKQFKLSCR
ncbi:PREDICTED: ras-related GTP-binding protein A-like [Amphimedon queenslandica]|uniref:Uncharacterized protein n=1 Tax=Amphimedon queenslandica TaxID=400682 RepID=A0AAN0IMU3_AMPQE|nr:PREDICTED: ras-related GTP-binding protein A-like [Amphimedon queenslandica]|eukprot:XP_011404170.1 PREDICTED: ras-related GTP-binding protein A-like [Amphimedon queenslandica]